MTSVQRNRTTHASRPVAQGLFAAALAMLGGCSADVTRFDFPAFNLTESGSNTQTGSLPRAGYEPSLAQRGPGPYDGPRGAGVGGYQPTQPYPSQGQYQGARGQPSTAATELPPIPDRAPPERYATRTPDRVPDRVSERAAVPERRYEAQRPSASGESIEVQPGDTLFGIAKRHGVQVGTLIEVNGLANGTSIKPGQRLLLPVGATPARPETRTPVASRPATQPIQQPIQTGAIDTPGWDGRYTLQPGDSLYNIARQHRTTLADLQRVNGITDATKVRAGTVLQVPGQANGAGSGLLAERTPEPSPSRTPAQTNLGPRVIQLPDAASGQARTGSGAASEPARIASRGDTATDASPGTGTETGTAKFRWPVTGGRMVGSFGKRPDGTHNDGINLAVPLGTEVRAADGGRVAYAGNELKGYGNLILIRHDNGWVTAYAHGDELLVKRDDVVRKGQVIARAGKTGTVDQPQVHFELRQGAKPVDPLPYLEPN
jgi:murein DD-endopeptidase MepM/ murein hydrolase activator NlpD